MVRNDRCFNVSSFCSHLTMRIFVEVVIFYHFPTDAEISAHPRRFRPDGIQNHSHSRIVENKVPTLPPYSRFSDVVSFVLWDLKKYSKGMVPCIPLNSLYVIMSTIYLWTWCIHFETMLRSQESLTGVRYRCV